MKILNSGAPVQASTPAVDQNSPLWKAAKGMEANFFKELVRKMRDTVEEGEDAKNDKALQLFRGMLDDEYAEKAVNVQGIGLAEVIVKQILEQQATRSEVHVRNLQESDYINK